MRKHYVKDYDPILSSKCVHIVDCDVARISKYGDTMFYIIGFRDSTRHDKTGVWIDENGNRKDWEYIREQVIASGKTEEELLDSVREYKRLSRMSALDWMSEQTGVDWNQFKICNNDYRTTR